MNSNENCNGWGAFQNKKKEIEILKKQLIVQDINKFGNVIILNKNNEFEKNNIKVNPFRFPNKIANEELQKNNTTLNNDDFLNYNKKLIEYNSYIYENDKIIKKIQLDFEEQTNKLKIDYEKKLLEQKNNYDKWCLIVSGLTELINDLKNTSETTNTISITTEELSQNENKEPTIFEEIINEKQENTLFQAEEINDIKLYSDTVVIHEIQDNINVINNLNKKGRKKQRVSEKKIEEGDTETHCLVEIDNIIYSIYYEYTGMLDTHIFMSKSSIVKHKGIIINFTFDETTNRFKFYINDKLIQISYKRPRTNMIKHTFNSTTIIRHKAVNENHTWYERDEKGYQCNGTHGTLYVTFEMYCIYIKTKNKFYRCDEHGNYNNEDEYKTLSPFIIDNYNKHIPYYKSTCKNQFEYLEYFCKKENKFKSFKDIWHDTKIN